MNYIALSPPGFNQKLNHNVMWKPTLMKPTLNPRRKSTLLDMHIAGVNYFSLENFGNAIHISMNCLNYNTFAKESRITSFSPREMNKIKFFCF
jgi:hypothetical protein